jgi:hypothetical protein
MKKGFELFAALLVLFVSFPIWFWLLYQVLVRVQASELMWFLFWVYVPVQIVCAAIVRMTADKK